MELKRIENKKRAVSPIISTVLLILIVIVIAVIILLWSKGFIKERVLKFNKPVDTVCDQDIKLKTFVNDDGSFGFTNDGNIPIHSFDLKISELGSSSVLRIEDRVNPGYSITIEPNDIGISDYYQLDEVKIIPVILGKTKSGSVKEFTCVERSGKFNI